MFGLAQLLILLHCWAVRGFTQALRADLDDTDINVTLYESGMVKSPYWEHNPGSAERNKKLIVIPFMMKIVYLQHGLFPAIFQWLMTKSGYKRK